MNSKGQRNSIWQAIQDRWWGWKPYRPLLSLIKELGLVVLLCQLLLSHKTLIDSWMVLFEEGGELHRVITGLDSLYSTIQSSITREEISEGAFYGIKGRTLLIWLALTLLCVSTEGAGKSPSPTILKLLLLTRRQWRLNYLNILFCDSH